MEHFHGKYLVAAAVFSLVATFTSAAVLGGACTGAGVGDCTGTGVVCNTNCVCDVTYKVDPDDATACILRVLGDSCTAGADAECAAVTNAVCKPTENVCACVGAYKQNGAACDAKGYGDSCSANSDCAGDANSECSTTCVCKTDFTAISNVCEIGLDNPCTVNTDCDAVSNAECTGTTGSKTCTCKATYKAVSGQCSSANGLQALLSAPVALLLSFLTIVVTRLH